MLTWKKGGWINSDSFAHYVQGKILMKTSMNLSEKKGIILRPITNRILSLAQLPHSVLLERLQQLYNNKNSLFGKQELSLALLVQKFIMESKNLKIIEELLLPGKSNLNNHVNAVIAFKKQNDNYLPIGIFIYGSTNVNEAEINYLYSLENKHLNLLIIFGLSFIATERISRDKKWIPKYSSVKIKLKNDDQDLLFKNMGFHLNNDQSMILNVENRDFFPLSKITDSLLL